MRDKQRRKKGILAGIGTLAETALNNFVFGLCCRQRLVIYDSVLSGW
jgi:hypothetical protein